MNHAEALITFHNYVLEENGCDQERQVGWLEVLGK